MPKAVHNDYAASRYAETAKNDIDRFCIGLIGIDAAKCAYDIEEAEREKHSAQKDLRAQRWMAIYAGAMACFAFFSLCITALGVHYIRKTLIQADKTNSAAVEAAQAANRSNEIMRQNSRPWLIIERELGCTFKVTDVWVVLTWCLRTLNVGKQPAFSVRSHSAVVRADQFRFREKLNDFIESNVVRADISPTLVSIFPTEQPSFSKSQIGTAIDGEGDSYLLFHMTAYRTWNDPKAEMGFDIRVYRIAENDGENPEVTTSHLLIEQRHERQTT